MSDALCFNGTVVGSLAPLLRGEGGVRGLRRFSKYRRLQLAERPRPSPHPLPAQGRGAREPTAVPSNRRPPFPGAFGNQEGPSWPSSNPN